jgi:structural maintenance of chromosome 4
LRSNLFSVDKTQVFHNQIEVKQKELQPWTMKINAKQAEVNVAQSERDTLAKKAESIKDALAEAAEKEKELREEHQTKVTETKA